MKTLPSRLRRSIRSSSQLHRFCLLAVLTTIPSLSLAQTTQKVQEAGIDHDGNIFVSSENGHRITMAPANHCLQASGTIEGETMLCFVSRGAGESGLPLPQLRLEVYLRGGKRVVIEPGGPIRDWHFWNDQQAISISFNDEKELARDSLYELETGQLIDTIDEPSDLSKLPQWAKSQSEIEDEAVPSSASLAVERSHWIAKMMRQIQTIHPGIRRKDLAPLFQTEGGLSTRTQRTYVLAECPYIKVVVRFKPATDPDDFVEGNPDDIIESISTPYLGYGIYD
jgi:hypothetical protein